MAMKSLTKAELKFVLSGTSASSIRVARDSALCAHHSAHLARATVGRESARYARDAAIGMADARRLGHAIMQRL